MTISTSPWGFTAYCSTQQNSNPSNASVWPGGVTGPAPASFNGGTNNTDGSTVTLLTALQVSFPVELAILEFTQLQTLATNNASIMDLMYDPAGGSSWVTFCDSIPVGGAVQIPNTISLAVYAPQGSSFGVRARGNSTTKLVPMRANLMLFGRPTGSGAFGEWAQSRGQLGRIAPGQQARRCRSRH